MNVKELSSKPVQEVDQPSDKAVCVTLSVVLLTKHLPRLAQSRADRLGFE